MSNIPTQRKVPVLDRRLGTIAELKRIIFNQIPEDLIDASVVLTTGQNKDGSAKTDLRYIYPLLRWARDQAQIFDDDKVTFVTVKELRSAWNKGNYVLLNEEEYTGETTAGEPCPLKKGVKIWMERHLKFGWRPARKKKESSAFE